MQSVFPNKLKTAKITAIFKAGDKTEVSNYRPPISVLPCFSKILERVMYNRLYNFLCENNMLYEKQFGFQSSHSTDHAIIQLIDEISKSFERNAFTLGVFIDLSKAFDTVNHQILLSKLNSYGIRDINCKWFKSYLSKRNQFVSYEHGKTDMSVVTCAVPQGSILGPLLFLIYINDMNKASKLLNPIMFADDSNLFYSHHDIKKLFEIVNNELRNIHEWFKANKLSLNRGKTNYVFFHKNTKTDYIPLKLAELHIADSKIIRKYEVKFLGIILHENLCWNKHIELIENKISKNLGVLYKAKYLLSQKCMINIYFSFIHSSYINYANIAWSSTNRSKLSKLFNKQKHASRIILFQDRHIPAKLLMTRLKPRANRPNMLRHLMFLNYYKQ